MTFIINPESQLEEVRRGNDAKISTICIPFDNNETPMTCEKGVKNENRPPLAIPH